MSDPVDFETELQDAIDRSARRLAEEARAVVTDHPDVEEMVAYQEGRLPAEGAEQLRRHLAACPDCARELLQLAAFDDELPDLLPSPSETAEDWGIFQRRIAEEVPDMPMLKVPGQKTPGNPRMSGSSGIWWLLAACVLIAGSGLAFWLAGFAQRTQPPIQQALQNPLELNLVPDGEVFLRDAASSQPVEIPAGMDSLLVRLRIGDQTPFADYRVDVVDAEDSTVWTRPGLRRQPAGHFIVLVGSGDLAAGRYRIELVGITGGQETVVAAYTFQFDHAVNE